MMALPPQQLSVKRRRDEDPVDCLYLQQKRVRSEFVWNRVTDEENPNGSVPHPVSTKLKDRLERAKNGSSRPKAPTVRATLPGEELSNTSKPNRSHVTTEQHSFVTRDESNEILQTPQKVMTAQTRKFHLSRNTFLSPSHVQAGHGIQKRRRKDPDRLAVFIEKKAKDDLQRASSRKPFYSTVDSKTALQHDIRPQEELQMSERPLKRPNATQAELAWRAKTWRNTPSMDESRNQRTDTSQSIYKKGLNDEGDITEEMLEVYQQMSQEAENGRVAAESKPLPEPGTKHEAISPSGPPLPNETTSMADYMEIEEPSDNDDKFVYDTYVRAEKPSQALGADALDGAASASSFDQADKVGILVIDEEDEQNWQEFLEEWSESEKEWDTDEEDENAEDYYGNDYPEDELDSDDAFDRHAYRYRIYGSEDEGFDSDLDGNWGIYCQRKIE